jgi:DNA-binding PadR family transcriptional regulator
MSELASFVLGLVWQHGPCTAYTIRRALLDSPSATWSGSAGAIYPLVERLERDGLLSGRALADGKRARREFSITARGRAALRAWIGPPLGAEAVTVTSDPLRSRARFLGLLSAAERRAWIAAAEAALTTVEANVRRWHEQYASDDAPELALVTRHAELELAFRRAWLEELRGLGIRPTAKARNQRRSLSE